MIQIERKDISRRLREILSEARDKRREITLMAQRPDDAACIDASGAIRLTIQDILPTLEGSLQLPPGLDLETGVTGNEIWPVSISDVAVEEEGEVTALTDHGLAFANTQCSPQIRTGITVEVSNMAIDSASFDLLDYIQRKFTLATRRYLAMRLYSTAAFDGNYGPFSSKHAGQWSGIEGSIYNSIMQRMTALQEAGFDTKEACIVMDFNMEAALKATPIRYGEGRMVIEDGLCCGYPYVPNKFFNTVLDDDGNLVPQNRAAVGIAIFKWFKIAQHGTARLIIDGNSQQVSARNITSITLNTSWSFTDLSETINGGDSMQAFHTLYLDARRYLADARSRVLVTSDGYALTVNMTPLG